MRLELVGNLNDSPLWRTVGRTAGEWLDACPATAAGWTISVRRKSSSDDDILVVDCEGDDPTDYWAVFIDQEVRKVDVAVAVDGDDDLAGPDEIAEFLLALLSGAADAVVDGA